MINCLWYHITTLSLQTWSLVSSHQHFSNCNEMSQRGRKRKLGTDLFEVNLEQKTASCLKCGLAVKSLKNFVFKRHYLNMHPEAASEMGLTDEEAPYLPKKVRKVSVRMNRDLYTKSLVQLVTAYGMPLRTLDSPPMRALLDPYEESFDMPSVNSRTIKPILRDKAAAIRSIIQKEVKGKMISLKLDIATRLDRDVLGINIQFMKKKTQTIRTIGMIELKKRHTAQAIKDDVMRVLRSFGISVDKIYTITTDNGSNMLATSKLIKIDLREFLEEL